MGGQKYPSLQNTKVHYQFYKRLKLDQLHPVHFNVFSMYIYTYQVVSFFQVFQLTKHHLNFCGYDIWNSGWRSQDIPTCFEKNLISTWSCHTKLLNKVSKNSMCTRWSRMAFPFKYQFSLMQWNVWAITIFLYSVWEREIMKGSINIWHLTELHLIFH